MNESRQERYRRTTNSYDIVAKQFAQRHWYSTKIKPTMQTFLGYLPPQPHILDAGCGPGRDLLLLKKYGAKPIGIDNSTEMVKEASSRSGQNVYLMDLRDLDFLTEEFDGVWANACLHHLEEIDLELTLSELSRVIKKDGLVFTSVKRGDSEFFDKEYPDNPRYFKKYWKSDLNRLARKANLSPVWSNVLKEPKTSWVQVIFRKVPSQADLFSSTLCNFCTNFGSETLKTNEIKKLHLWDNPILESENFVVIQALGQLLPGYLLIVTKKHIPYFGSLNKLLFDELEEILKKTRLLLEKNFGEVCFFEHARTLKKPGHNRNRHAHLHVAPVPQSFCDEVRHRFKPHSVSSIRSIFDVVKDLNSYFYLEDKNRLCQILVPPRNLPSQYFRRILSRKLNMIGEWDWRRFSHEKNIKLTAGILNLEGKNRNNKNG